MNSTPYKSSSKPVKNRLGLKLTALFAGTFLLVFVGLLFLDLLAGIGERILVDSSVSNQPAVTAIDPKIESDLAKVLEYSDVQNTADIKNPFADQSGISDLLNPAASQNAAQTTNASKTANPAATRISAQTNQSQQNSATRTIQPNQSVIRDPQMETKARLQLRQERIRLGMDGGPEATVFSVDDLLPVGTVGGGDGKDEVMFYSKSACRVVSFPVGTQFYDGWLNALREDGVVFGYSDQFRIPVTRLWETSAETKCSDKVSELTLLDQSAATGGGD